MRPPVRVGRGTTIALGIALAYGAGFWLVALHHAEGGHERSEPGLLLHALRDGSLALPAVLAAVWVGAILALMLVDPRGRLTDRWRAALIAAGAAGLGAVVLAAGNPLHALLFDAEDAHDLPVALHLGRDTLIALAAGLPLALAVVAAPGLARAVRSRRTQPTSPQPPLPQTLAPVSTRPSPLEPASTKSIWGGPLTRRGFVVGGVAGVTLAGLGVNTAAQRRAQSLPPTDRLHLYINDGHVPMVDGTLVYMRGYGGEPVGDPKPSLEIDPQVFLADRVGPLARRTYPVLADSQVPVHGSPTPSGVDQSGVGTHLIRRQHWTSFFPKRTIVAETGSTIRLRITNRLTEPHTFTIPGVIDETIGPAGSATETKDIEFAAPGPGTYIYQDTRQAPVNRTLGLFGVLVVVPADRPWTLDGREGEFERQWLWIFHDVDPEWGRRARMGATIDPAATPSLPRYFTINGRSGVYSLAVSPDEDENERTLEDTKPSGWARYVDVRDFSAANSGTGQLIRLVNAGVATHQPHFHGNHVWTIAIDNETLSRSAPRVNADGNLLFQHWEDVVDLDPLSTKAVMLPMKPPPDELEEVLAGQACEYVYPMHCHAEMSQTAGGGLYPGGQVTDWILKP